jgi:ribosome-associated translation inhibitor RaiA
MNTQSKLTTLPWNLVTRNLHGHELLRKKVHQKISKLEKHLCKFPQGTVHLHISLDEVAMVLGQSPARIRTLLKSLGERIRTEVLNQGFV